MDITALLEKIQTVARNGFNYTQNVYDRERHERLLALSCDQYADLLERPSTEVRTKLSRELGHVTPQLGGDAAIFTKQGHILLLDRVDGSGWCLPCGWVEPGERPASRSKRAWQSRAKAFRQAPHAAHGLGRVLPMDAG